MLEEKDIEAVRKDFEVEQKGTEVSVHFIVDPPFTAAHSTMLNRIFAERFPYNLADKGQDKIEIATWCRENMREPWCMGWASVWFSSEIDATLFRIRWH